MHGFDRCTVHQDGDVTPKNAVASRVRCSAHVASTGKPCRKWAQTGQGVCDTHGGSTQQARAAAKERMLEMVLPAMLRLREIVDQPSTSDGDRLRAIEMILNRTGFSSKTEVSLDIRPWEQAVGDILIDVTETATVTAPMPDVIADAQADHDREVLASIPDAEIIELADHVPAKGEKRASRVPGYVRERL